MSLFLDWCKMRVYKRGKTAVNGYDLKRGKWQKKSKLGS